MKNFAVFCLKVLVLLFIVAWLLDCAFTFVYQRAAAQHKIDKVVNSQGLAYDVVILGSSRANNHFIPEMFHKKGLKTYNYGMSGSKLQETALLLELMVAHNFKIKNAIIEVDLNLNSESFSQSARGRFMPYLQSSEIISEFYKNKLEDFRYLYYVPFYRYIKYDFQIGAREVFFALSNRTNARMKNEGFFPLYNKGKNMKYDLRKMTPKTNRDYEAIKKICREANINLIAVTTPMCANAKGMVYFDKIAEIYPEVQRYDKVITEDKYFSSCGHMNAEGAKVLTEKIIQEHF